jgi:hypothetical protein
VRFRRGIENARAFGDDFLANAVTRDQRYVEFFHGMVLITVARLQSVNICS